MTSPAPPTERQSPPKKMKAPRVTARLRIEIVLSDAATVAEKPKESKEYVPSWTEHIANPRPVEAWSVRRARKQ